MKEFLEKAVNGDLNKLLAYPVATVAELPESQTFSFLFNQGTLEITPDEACLPMKLPLNKNGVSHKLEVYKIQLNLLAPRPPCFVRPSDPSQLWDLKWRQCSNIPGASVHMFNDQTKVAEFCERVVAYINRSGNEELRKYINLPHRQDTMGSVGSHHYGHK